jgi:hypothetical protein
MKIKYDPRFQNRGFDLEKGLSTEGIEAYLENELRRFEAGKKIVAINKLDEQIAVSNQEDTIEADS